MSDVFTPKKRSEMMALIRVRDTKPECVVRSMLHRVGYRFTINGGRNRSLPGKPDIVLPAHQTVVFVHGCFWHAHENCEYFRLPKTRKAWWRAKLVKNKERDALVEKALIESGWNVVTIWECATKTKLDREWLLDRLPMLIG
jgi:DNA mismatch endonuclease (patch repair protein)